MTPIVDMRGELLASLMLMGNGRQVKRSWLVYWGLKHAERENRRFSCRKEALTWVRNQFPDARLVKQ